MVYPFMILGRAGLVDTPQPEHPSGEEKVGRAMTSQLSENQRRYNLLAIMACCMGLVPLLYVSAGLAELTDLLIEVLLPVLLLGGGAVAVGVVGLKQIKTTGQRGRGLAIAGCVAGAAVFAVLAFLLVALMVKGTCGLPDGCEG
ncbi:DUF4190 domain-containing protein [Micromonospora eburnea]|uniref:DUF4190 domain-containing protein n=1 Tax=Micromonospora eburnea TaxID=227316 RepID=A0A1C6VP04_9ACTN|nr:DUF4190 domain-containing protein [Micromonospora eburnea]SCL67844.1 hypothetical protein GA0070604_6116 [Micromonospora eburnea]